MPDRLVPIVLPPGIYDISTHYDDRGRWHEGNLIRFEDRSARPIGGWVRRTDSAGADIPALYGDPTIEAARNIISWRDNILALHIVIGTNRGLYYISQTGVLTNITPVGFTPGQKEPSTIVGYGIGRYGAEAYGTPRASGGTIEGPSASWSFALWGDILLAQFRGDGPLYEWDPNVDPVAVSIPEAPINSQSVLVTDQRMAMLLSEDTRSVTWCDAEDYHDWTPAVTNTAGSFALTGQGTLRELIKSGPDIVVLSDVDVWVARYIRPPYVYGFERAARNSGTWAPNSAVSAYGRAYWHGPGGFFQYAPGGGVEELRCDVLDLFINSIRRSVISKSIGFSNSEFREVTWFVESGLSTTTEPDMYFTHSLDTPHWTTGFIDRTCAAPIGPTPDPVMVSPDGIVYNHELEGVYPAAALAPYIISGPLELGNGGRRMGIQFLFPDAQPRSENVSVEFLAKDLPTVIGDRTYGPYNLSTSDPEPIPTTGANGREIRMKVMFGSSDSQLGTMRIQPIDLGAR